MVETLEIDKIQKKAFYSGIRDGLIEIFIGVMMFFVGLMFQNIWFIFVIAISNMLWSKISHKLKIAYVYNRIGFVDLNLDNKQRLKKFRILFVIIQGSSIVLLFIIVYFVDWRINTLMKYVPIIICAGFIGESLYFCIFSDKWTYLWIGISSIILAVFFILYPFPTGKDHTIYYVWTESFLLICIGTIKFRQFLRNNPIIEEKLE